MSRPVALRFARALFVVLSALLALPAAAQIVAAWPTRGWKTATPAEQGVKPEPWAALDSAVRAGRYGNIDRVLVIRRGYKVLDYRYARDYRTIAAGRRSPIGCGPGACEGFHETPGFNYFDPGTHPFYQGRDVHSLQSVTKSVIATIVGAAVHHNAIKSLTAPLMSYLARYSDEPRDPRLARATLEDALTMRSGIEWHE